MSKARKQSLVTGGAGFMGSHVVQHLLEMGHDVVVLDDLSTGVQENIPEGATSVVGSITDPVLVNTLFENYRFHYVYHLAAYAAEGLSPFIRKFNYENNVIGSINLINASVNYGVECFVFTSSIAVYGSSTPPFVETTIPQPEDPYGIAKYAVEMDLQNAQHMFGLNSIVFRPHNVYGSRQNIWDRYRNVAGIFMNQVRQGLPLSIFGDGQQTRAFTHIDDVAPYIASSVIVPEAYNQTFNVGSDEVYSVNALAKEVLHAMGSDAEMEYHQARNEAVHAFAVHDKFRKVFHHVPAVSLQKGLAEMAEWVKQQAPRESQSFKHIEINQHLPPLWS